MYEKTLQTNSNFKYQVLFNQLMFVFISIIIRNIIFIIFCTFLVIQSTFLIIITTSEVIFLSFLSIRSIFLIIFIISVIIFTLLIIIRNIIFILMNLKNTLWRNKKWVHFKVKNKKTAKKRFIINNILYIEILFIPPNRS